MNIDNNNLIFPIIQYDHSKRELSAEFITVNPEDIRRIYKIDHDSDQSIYTPYRITIERNPATWDSYNNVEIPPQCTTYTINKPNYEELNAYFKLNPTKYLYPELCEKIPQPCIINAIMELEI